MDILQSIFFLFVCTVLQLALGQETEGDINVGFIGGHEIEIEDAPFMAGFLRNGRLVCAGSIIDRQFILTSASCNKRAYPIRRAHVGTKQALKGGYFVDVVYSVCHEQYNEITSDNNICLIKLRKPVFLVKGGRSEIAIVDLPEKNINTAPGTLVNVTGWGTISNSPDYPKNLQQANIRVVPDVDCSHFARNMTENMLCAGNKGSYACRGDGGGPLTQNNVQLGIVSYDPVKCYGSLMIYTKVSKYFTWIKKTIREHS